MDCNEFITSENTYEFIVAEDETANALIPPNCQLLINERYAIWYYDNSGIPPLSIRSDSYNAIPVCYGLQNEIALTESGIVTLQNLPTLSLNGQGVFIAIIDTGINYELQTFRTEEGKTRIHAMWDQTADITKEQNQSGAVAYGREYVRWQIDEALASDNPLDVVPERDEVGHGTFLASVAAGGTSVEESFAGAAPKAELLVVKLKRAKQNLYDFYQIPSSQLAYAESDIMAAISYVERVARGEGKPLVICLGVGSNLGNHRGNSPLCDYLNTIATEKGRAVVVAAGNQGNSRHHFSGTVKSAENPRQIEINVPERVDGFCMELWAIAPELFLASVESPTGERYPKGILPEQIKGEHVFLLENTTLSIDYTNEGRNTRDMLIFFRFRNPAPGIWKIHVYPKQIVGGEFHMWLPERGIYEADITFLDASPEVTITSPADANAVISVGGYQSGGGTYVQSGRGYTIDHKIKPDFVAPATEIIGRDIRGNLTTASGTSAATAITVGACAQLLEWAIVKKNATNFNSVDLKNLLILGAKRNPLGNYPNPLEGYGRLSIYKSFLLIR